MLEALRSLADTGQLKSRNYAMVDLLDRGLAEYFLKKETLKSEYRIMNVEYRMSKDCILSILYKMFERSLPSGLEAGS